MKRILVLLLSGSLVILSYSAAFAQAVSSGAASSGSGPAAGVTPAAPASVDPLADYKAAGAACQAALQKAVALRAEGKWRSAFDVLAVYDPNNMDPYALAMKTRLCLDGLVQTEQFQSFALIDLGKGETLDQVRQSGSDAKSFAFDPPALAAAIKAKMGAIPPVLSKVLGDYYYVAQAEYTGHWVMSDAEAYQKSLEEYQAAYAAGVYDADSLQNMGELLMRTGQEADAAPLFQKSIALNPANGIAHYNYAICLYKQGDVKAALDNLDKAVALFQNPREKLQVYNVAARAAAQAGEASRSEAYIEKIEALDPQAPNANLLRQELAVKAKDKAAANKAADALMVHFSDNPGVVRSLVSVWYDNGDEADARAFLDRTIAAKKDDKSLGTLQFYFALLLAQGSPSNADKKAAIAALDESEAHMKKVLPPDSSFFGVVEQIRGQLLGQAAPEQPAPAAPASSGAPAGAAQSQAAAPASGGSASSNAPSAGVSSSSTK